MCFIPTVKQKTIEEIIAENSTGMTDDQRAQYAYELDQQAHRVLTKVMGIEWFTIDFPKFKETIIAQYPKLSDMECPDWNFTITTQDWMQKILSKDWVNKVPYISDISDCDKFAERLYLHMCDYYGLNSVIDVWGQTDSGYHGFNITVFKDGENYIARCIEPQADTIFIESGPLGKYVPDKIVSKLAVLKV